MLPPNPHLLDILLFRAEKGEQGRPLGCIAPSLRLRELVGRNVLKMPNSRHESSRQKEKPFAEKLKAFFRVGRTHGFPRPQEDELVSIWKRWLLLN